jgi:UDP-N-acetylglucosamine 2-epimerase
LTEVAKSIALVFGTRPEIIKNFAIIKELDSQDIMLNLINTGQHFNYEMNQVFLDELGLRTPSYNLGVRGGSRIKQLASILLRLERIFKESRPNLVLVLGDTTSTLGGAMAAAQMGIPLAHIEAGCRSFDWRMPEELNRVVVDDLADLHFAPTTLQERNLLAERTNAASIHVVGDPTVELLDAFTDRISGRETLHDFGLNHNSYYLLTVHRAENLSSESNLRGILDAASLLSREFPVLFPLHPHTKLEIHKAGLQNRLQKLKVVAPQPYGRMLDLISNSRMVLTDSGGLQHETPLLGRFCITLRDNTEWIETVNMGVNFLTGTNTQKILDQVKKVERSGPFPKEKSKRLRKLLGNGLASKRIAETCRARVSQEL